MNWMNNLSFRWKLWIPLSIVSATLVALAITAVTTTQGIGDKTHTIGDQYLPSIDFLLQADRDLYQSLVAERSMSLPNIDAATLNSLREQHSENMAQASERVGKFAALHDDATIKKHYAEYEQLRDRWENLSNQVVSLYSQGDETSKNKAIALSFGEADVVFGKMRDILDQLTETTLGKVAELREASNATIDTGITTTTIIAAVGLTLCLVLAIALPGLIVGPIKKMIGHVHELAQGEGDLTVRIESKGKDELGQMAEEINSFISQLQATVRGIVNSTSEISGAASEVLQLASENRSSVDQQLREIEQVATAMHEMTVTVQDVSRNATTAFEGATEADKAAEDGKKVVMKTVSAIHDLAGEVENVSVVVGELKDESSNIGSVLNVIQSIAEQTNLLALNAAIEAARAGEQGRGFAVVADEVRTLASRTQESTQEIQSMIESLQSRAARAVEVMALGRDKAGASVEHASSAGESLEHITTAVARINDMNAQIASAAEEQSAVAESINRNTVSIRDHADHATNSGHQTSSAAERMAQLSNALQQQVSHFKV
ncbi:methyl-accepting chemotaxis protein [Thiosocius teredinicola]|uniref:methyl-accepting chemotaxis protein n=1 Tax=Thiosocius teredinicola TaxID=1973002 RepID=UPI000990D422